MVGDFGWEHEGTECQVDTVNVNGLHHIEVRATY